MATVVGVLKPLVGVLCLLLVAEGLRTGRSLTLSRMGIGWVELSAEPAGFWVSIAVLVALAAISFGASVRLFNR